MNAANPISKKPAFNFSKIKNRLTAQAANYETSISLICPICRQSWNEEQLAEHLTFHRRKPKGRIVDVETILKLAQQKKSLQCDDSVAGSWFIRSEQMDKNSSSGQSPMRRISEQIEVKSKRNSELSHIQIAQTEQSMIQKSQADVKHRRRFSQTGKIGIQAFQNPQRQSKKQSSSLIDNLKESFNGHHPEQTINFPQSYRHTLQKSYCSNMSEPSQSDCRVKHQRAKNPLIHFDT